MPPIHEVESSPHMQKLVLLAPGQGQQRVRMGEKVYNQYDEAKVFQAIVDEVSGLDVTSVRFNGPQELLNETRYAQLSLFADFFSNLYISRKYGDGELKEQAHAGAGHSFGQVLVAVAAGCLGDYMHDPVGVCQRGAELVLARAEATEAAAKVNPGGMMAVGINVDHEFAVKNRKDTLPLKDVLDLYSAYLSVINTKEQVVIGGSDVSLDALTEFFNQMGIAPARLPITIPSHTPLMADAQKHFAPKVRKLVKYDPVYPVISNIDGRQLHTAEEVQIELIEDLVKTVRWDLVISSLDKNGFHNALEYGRGLLAKFNIKEIKDSGIDPKAAAVLAAAALGIAAVYWMKHHNQKNP